MAQERDTGDCPAVRAFAGKLVGRRCAGRQPAPGVMGLTIYYRLRAPEGCDPGEVMEKLRQAALDLPVKEVSDKVFHLVGQACNYQSLGRDHPLRWALIQAQDWADEVEPGTGGKVSLSVAPLELYVFSVWPGEGCEEANFGLARYPDRIGWNGRVVQVPDGGVWRWRSFCKTQYASNVSIEHFVRCHVAVCCLLREAEKLGILQEVHDEGHFWDTWDIGALAREVSKWNTFIAGMAKALEESGLSFSAPIMANPEYPVLRELGNPEASRKLVELLQKHARQEDSPGSGRRF